MKIKTTNSVAIEIIVHGKIKQLGYRRFVYKQAKELKLMGMVKYLEEAQLDGLVIIAEGKMSSIELFLKKCRKDYPFVEINSFEYREIELQNFKEFKIYPIRQKSKWQFVLSNFLKR
jgi:acylphosphatase